jgi:hypothetical protein
MSSEDNWGIRHERRVLRVAFGPVNFVGTINRYYN